MNLYSRASWVFPLRSKSDAPAQYQDLDCEDGERNGQHDQAVMFDNMQEFVVEK